MKFPIAKFPLPFLRLPTINELSMMLESNEKAVLVEVKPIASGGREWVLISEEFHQSTPARRNPAP